MEDGDENRKRSRVDSDGCDSDAGESKRIKSRSDSEELIVDSVVSGIDSSELGTMINNDILEILDDHNVTTESEADISSLDSVIKSFEEEILHTSPVPVTVTVTESADQPFLGYLLEASDDELGLPPAVSPTTEKQTKNDVPCYDSFGFDNELPSYDAFEYGFGMESQLVSEEGLFEFSDEAPEFSEFLWRPETESSPAVW